MSYPSNFCRQDSSKQKQCEPEKQNTNKCERNGSKNAERSVELDCTNENSPVCKLCGEPIAQCQTDNSRSSKSFKIEPKNCDKTAEDVCNRMPKKCERPKEEKKIECKPCNCKKEDKGESKVECQKEFRGDILPSQRYPTSKLKANSEFFRINPRKARTESCGSPELIRIKDMDGKFIYFSPMWTMSTYQEEPACTPMFYC